MGEEPTTPVPVLLWRIGDVACPSRALPFGFIEFTLARDNVIVDRRICSNSAEAADHAVAKTPPSHHDLRD